MGKPDLSVIIPFAGEYPQVLFTVQAIAESLHGKIDFEIIVIDNHCKELEGQWKVARTRVAESLIRTAINSEAWFSDQDILDLVPGLKCMQDANKSGEALKASAGGNPWLKYMTFDKYLSHWECKRLACLEAKADTFLFIDAHCVPSNHIAEMYDCYDQNYRNVASFHMPLTYKILEWRRLVYKLVIKDDFYGYSFTTFPGVKDCNEEPVEVPCMSTCGMMLSREMYDRIGGWPKGMGAYGGGENFMNYALSVIGAPKYIYPPITLHHHGEKRDYHSTYDGTVFNRLLAHFLFGGLEKLDLLITATKGNPETLKKMKQSILDNPTHMDHRATIKKNTLTTIDTWAEDWGVK